MDYGPLVLYYKQLFAGQGQVGPSKIPKNEFLMAAARVVVYLREKGQTVKEMVNGDLYIDFIPSCIGLAVHPKDLFRVWFSPETFEYSDQKHIWDGEWSRWIGEILGYKSEIHIGANDIVAFNPEQTAEKLLQVSTKFMGSFPEVKAALDKLEASREELYSNTKDELAKILA